MLNSKLISHSQQLILPNAHSMPIPTSTVNM